MSVHNLDDDVEQEEDGDEVYEEVNADELVVGAGSGQKHVGFTGASLANHDDG